MVWAMISLISCITSYSNDCLSAGMALQEGHPVGQRQLRHAGLGDADDAVGRGRAQPPGGVAGFHVALVGEAQDHFLGLLVGHHALEDAVEDEVLLHLVHALVQQESPLLQSTITRCGSSSAICAAVMPFSSDVLRQLNANDVSFGMVIYDDMRYGVGRLARIHGRARSILGKLTVVKGGKMARVL